MPRETWSVLPSRGSSAGEGMHPVHACGRAAAEEDIETSVGRTDALLSPNVSVLLIQSWGSATVRGMLVP